MNDKKEKSCILFGSGKGKYKEATPKEIELGITPANVESVIYLKSDGTYSRRFIDPLGR